MSEGHYGSVEAEIAGVDIKEADGEFIVIEVDDSPNIDAGGEDARNPEVYGRVAKYLAGEA